MSGGGAVPMDEIVPTIEEEWGVIYGDPPVPTSISPKGVGDLGKRFAEQDVERTLHNATLPFVGQPKVARIVRRTVTRYYDATPWEQQTSPGKPHPAHPHNAADGAAGERGASCFYCRRGMHHSCVSGEDPCGCCDGGRAVDDG